METGQNYCIKSVFLSKLILSKDGLMIQHYTSQYYK